MQSVQNDYDARVVEVDGYFLFLKFLDSNPKDVLTSMQSASINDAALFKTLKANSFLLLYNLMEAVTKNAIQGIYDHLKSEGIEYDDCCQQLKRVILKNVKHEKLGIDTMYARLGVLVQHIITETYQSKYLLSGGVDGDALRDLAKDYGVSSKLSTRQSDGKRLADVKKHRNALAHGNQTFDEVGKDAVLSDLEDIKVNVFVFMQQFILNVDDYLQKKRYLSVNVPAKTI